MKFKQWCDGCNRRVDVETDEIKVCECPTCGRPLMPCPICHGQKVKDDLGCKNGCTLRQDFLEKEKNSVTNACVM